MEIKSIKLKEDIIPDLQDLVELCNSPGWYHYAEDLDKPKCAFAHSSKVATAWDGEQLMNDDTESPCNGWPSFNLSSQQTYQANRVRGWPLVG